MAVPASGTIKFSGIYSELINDDYNQDLDQAPNRPDGSAPHTMSEFYSYDHDA
jgi:hypothetical protein